MGNSPKPKHVEVSDELQAIIDTLPDDDMIAIGAQSGYIWFGHPDEYAKIKNGLNATLDDRYINKAFELRRSMATAITRANDQLKTIDKATNAIKDATVSIEEMEQTIKKLAEKASEWKPAPEDGKTMAKCKKHVVTQYEDISLAVERVKDYLDSIDHAIKEYQRVPNILEPIPRQIERLVQRDIDREPFVPLDQRKVKGQYRRITDKGTSIIIDGDETGLFWDYPEFNRHVHAERVEIVAAKSMAALLKLKKDRNIDEALKLAGLED